MPLEYSWINIVQGGKGWKIAAGEGLKWLNGVWPLKSMILYVKCELQHKHKSQAPPTVLLGFIDKKRYM